MCADSKVPTMGHLISRLGPLLVLASAIMVNMNFVSKKQGVAHAKASFLGGREKQNGLVIYS